MDRRHFLKTSAVAGTLAATGMRGQTNKVTPAHPPLRDLFPSNGTPIADEEWNIWVDQKASWQNDEVYLPGTFHVEKLPVNPPTGGWSTLEQQMQSFNSAVVNLPATVEEHFWGKFGSRPYTTDEYRYASDDHTPQNGAFTGVSWWWKDIDIPASMQGQRILLQIRSARMRAEVYLNEKLTGYSIMEELPFECDLTHAAKPGGKNRLAIRITNPGGRFDWQDYTIVNWGGVNIYRAHGFAGLDRGLVLQAAPLSGRITDAWVLNTPNARTIAAHATIDGAVDDVLFEVIDPRTREVLSRQVGELSEPRKNQGRIMRAALSCPSAQLWDLTTPVLYHLRTTCRTQGHTDVRLTTFGFRWFAPEGVGTNALFRLNGRRIKLYSSISWGFWGLNGIFPTPALAEREVTQAQKLNLNCLNFHRNVGKEEVFQQHDRLGLLRYMEPGAGRLAIEKNPNSSGVMPTPTPADEFLRQFMLEKCRYMVRAFRSHPSLIQYTLQNELVANLKNPTNFDPLYIMHEEDPSRIVLLSDGFNSPPTNALQAWFPPYGSTMHRSDQEELGDWFNSHQGAGDQWYDRFYKNATHFNYYKPLKAPIVEYGEMEGCAVADNHPLMMHQILTKEFGSSGKSYDLQDHREILASCDQFIDRWGFRKAFPTAEGLYASLGDKCFESWQQYMENIRICDELDFGVISGWESTAVENHSGIVDNLRNFKGNPQLIASSLLPVRPVAKQHSLCCATGDSATFDLFFLNDTGKTISGKLHFTMTAPGGKTTELGSWDVPFNIPDQFSYPIQLEFKTPPLTAEGIYRFRFAADAAPDSDFSRDIWVANAKVNFTKPVRVGISNVWIPIREQIASLPGVTVSDFTPSGTYDLILTSGVTKTPPKSIKIDETGVEPPPAKGKESEPYTPGKIPDEVLVAVKSGTPLLIMAPEDALSDGIATQLAANGAFTYKGLVGDIRAPWMGNWLFVRDHPTFQSLPVNRALSIHYQAEGKNSNGLLVERAPGAPDLEVIMGYSRDHDRRIGAASFLTSLDKGRILFHRAPAFSPPLQQRWLANSVAMLTGVNTIA